MQHGSKMLDGWPHSYTTLPAPSDLPVRVSGAETTEARCENWWGCSKSTLFWQRIHCTCLIEFLARCSAPEVGDRDGA